MKILASVRMVGTYFRRLANTRFERKIVICIKHAPLKVSLKISNWQL